MSARQALIIGATGAIGHSIILEALSAGHCLRVLAGNPTSPLIPAGVEVVKGTAENADDFSRSDTRRY
ncbi:MAG: NmrA family NAD(P)-binding protein [Blastocatellia bacterium]